MKASTKWSDEIWQAHQIKKWFASHASHQLVQQSHNWLCSAKSLASDRNPLISLAIGRTVRGLLTPSHYALGSWALHQGDLQDLADLEDQTSQADISADGNQ